MISSVYPSCVALYWGSSPSSMEGIGTGTSSSAFFFSQLSTSTADPGPGRGGEPTGCEPRV